MWKKAVILLLCTVVVGCGKAASDSLSPTPPPSFGNLSTGTVTPIGVTFSNADLHGVWYLSGVSLNGNPVDRGVLLNGMNIMTFDAAGNITGGVIDVRYGNEGATLLTINSGRVKVKADGLVTTRQLAADGSETLVDEPVRVSNNMLMSVVYGKMLPSKDVMHFAVDTTTGGHYLMTAIKEKGLFAEGLLGGGATWHLFGLNAYDTTVVLGDPATSTTLETRMGSLYGTLASMLGGISHSGGFDVMLTGETPAVDISGMFGDTIDAATTTGPAKGQDTSTWVNGPVTADFTPAPSQFEMIQGKLTPDTYGFTFGFNYNFLPPVIDGTDENGPIKKNDFFRHGDGIPHGKGMAWGIRAGGTFAKRDLLNAAGTDTVWHMVGASIGTVHTGTVWGKMVLRYAADVTAASGKYTVVSGEYHPSYIGGGGSGIGIVGGEIILDSTGVATGFYRTDYPGWEPTFNAPGYSCKLAPSKQHMYCNTKITSSNASEFLILMKAAER